MEAHIVVLHDLAESLNHLKMLLTRMTKFSTVNPSTYMTVLFYYYRVFCKVQCTLDQTYRSERPYLPCLLLLGGVHA